VAGRPFLLVQARVRPSRLAEFRRWYLAEHLPHVLAIPGVVEYRLLRWSGTPRRDAPNVMTAFIFKDESVIHEALQSREAQRARRDWERWGGDVRDLSVQVYARMDARASIRHLN
jgi:quinol monooxygenase YgiN